VFQPVVQLSSMLSVLVAGYLASTVLHGLHARVLGVHIGAIDTIFASAGILVLLSGIYARTALPANVSMPKPPGAPPAPPPEAGAAGAAALAETEVAAGDVVAGDAIAEAGLDAEAVLDGAAD
jgi:hypothetical protein